MIDPQREKEFLFDLELLYHRYNLVIDSKIWGFIALEEADAGDEDVTGRFIEDHIDDLRGTG